MNQEINELAERMFSINIINDEIDDDICDAIIDDAKAQILKFGWDEVFLCWEKYLYTNVKSFEEAWSYAAWLLSIGVSNYPIGNPYEFLGYIYYIMGDKALDASAIMDCFSAEVLACSAGRLELVKPYNSGYIVSEDPMMISCIKNWKEKLG
ncbi:MAG: hypothetical protein LUD51_02760 [Clostridia bacterium]|nr:hypothetical protein [Clostridia bacterium]